MDYLLYRFSALAPETTNLQLLPEAEQAVAVRKGGNYAIIRTLLRQELARRSGVPAQDISFSYSEHGKPIFNAQPFNISHSGDLLCMAFHHSCVGVDIERMRPRRFASLAARTMCPEQMEAFMERGCQQEEFYSCWCAAEALVKWAGDTVWNARLYPFIYHPNRIECLFANAPRVELFSPEQGYMGAVAYTL